jgi:hypothetical protein
MKRFVKLFTAIGLLLNLQLSAQIAIGQYTLSRIAAPALEASIGAGGFTGGFLASVGGVAFKEIAQPAPALAAQSVVLEYAPQYPDGRRVVAIIDGQRVPVNLYDWQLQPIARFAQSDEHAVFTLFGKLADQRQEREVLDNGGRVVNYHPAFQDTLLGLRMLQLDNLLAGSKGDDLAVELPREHSRYLLGPGEASPDVARNRTALARYNAALKAGLGEAAADFRSYVVGDSGREVRFDVAQGMLRISGEPGYYFWRYNGDDPAVRDRLLASVRARIQASKRAAQQSQGAAFDERSWLVSQILSILRAIDGGPASASVVQELKLLDIADLNETLKDARAEQTQAQPAYRKIQARALLNQYVNSHLDMVRNINPVVWDASTTVMRYAAFFRYCKQNNPSAWQDFAERAAAIQVRPAVTTPTVLQIASARPGSDRLPIR